MNSIALLRLKEFADPFLQLKNWVSSDFSPPSPSFVKRKILTRCGIPSAPWIETGTYLGSTTRLLARRSSKVISIEPSHWLYSHAKRRLARFPNIELLNGTSEDLLDGVLSGIQGSELNLWLDGHYSAGPTYRGESETPIARELDVVARHLPRFSQVTVFIDDIRCFTSGRHRDENYPELDTLPNWCRRNSVRWSIEHDIFIAKHQRS